MLTYADVLLWAAHVLEKCVAIHHARLHCFATMQEKYIRNILEIYYVTPLRGKRGKMSDILTYMRESERASERHRQRQ